MKTLTRGQRKQIMEATGCSRASAENRAKVAIDRGESIDYCLEQGLFNLQVPALKNYLSSNVMRGYAEEKAKQLDIREYDIVRQMRVARDIYEIQPFDFAKHDLFGKTEEELASFKDRQKLAARNRIKKLMKAMDMSEDEVKAELARIKEKFGITATKFYKSRLYGKSDEEIQQFLSDRKDQKSDSIRSMAKASGWTEDEVVRDMNIKAAKFGIQRSDYPILKCYELSDELLETYGNLRDSRMLCEKYNDKSATKYLRRKDFFNAHYADYIGRKYWTNRNSSLQEYLEFSNGLDEVFCKPVDAANAKGTRLVELRGKDPREMYEWFMEQPLMLIEERVRQHHELDEFYDGSVNTIRLFTILDESEFVVFASFIRIGANGSIADNLIAGGVGCGIDVETGMICTSAIDHDGTIYEEHPNSGKRFEGFKIPHWDMALELAERALRHDPDLNYIGWDIAIREDDVVLIEGNSVPDIGTCQLFFNIERQGIKHTYDKYLPKSADASMDMGNFE